MLALILIFAIYGLLQKCLIDWPLVRRIRRSKTAKDTIACRKKLRFRRRLFLIIYVLIVLVLPRFVQSMENIEVTGIVDPRYFAWVLVLPLFLYWYLISSKNLDRLMGNISTSDKTTFLSSHKDYVLYLRGFETDDYSSETKQLKKSRKRNSRFSEYYFTRVLQTKETVCAVGMTKEVEAPIGAQRVYLDDETWQEDVRDLMRSAKEIYILVNDRPSCIWEIGQSLSMLGKTIFLVDEREKYDKVRQLGSEQGIEFPEMPHSAETQSHDFVVIRFKDGNAECRSYDKSLNGYAKMMGVSAPRIRKPGDMGCGCACLIVAAFLIYAWCEQSLNEEWSQKIRGMQEQGAYAVPRPSDREYGLLVSSVLDNVVIPAPENSVEVVRGSERFAELEKVDEGDMIGLKRFYCKSTSGLDGPLLNGLMDVGITAPIYVKQKWQPASFKTEVEKGGEEIVPGKRLASQTESNYQFEGEIYDKYEMNSSYVFASEVGYRSFSYSVLRVENFVKGARTITSCLLLTNRFILIKGRILLLRAIDVFLDREEAMSHIGEQGKRLEKWGEMIEARNRGVAEPRCEYDERGNVTRMQWFDVDGKLLLNKDGVAEARFEYDARGNVTKESYLGIDGKLTLTKDGYAEVRTDYNARGNITKESYFGIDGKLTLNKNGYAEVRTDCDARGNITKESYFSVDGKPTLHKNGYAEVSFEYNARGNVTKVQYFGMDGKPTLHKGGYAEVGFEYDARGNKTKAQRFGVDGKPKADVDGIAEIRWAYDARGNVTNESYFGIDRKPKADKDGAFELRFEYGQDGKKRRLSLIYVDAGGMMSRDDEIAEERFEYDARGNVTRIQSFGIDGKPKADKDGVFELRSEYDERGNVKRRLLFDVKGELIQDGIPSEEVSRR